MVPGRISAEQTAAVLWHAARGGGPVMIPGAVERRLARPLPSANPIGAAVGPRVPEAAPDDRQRLEYERQGGGAPSQRRGAVRATFGAKIWRSFLHPENVAVIWGRVSHA